MKPDPPITVRQRLICARRLPVPPDFDTAWDQALRGNIWPHDTDERRAWKEVLASTRWAFERAYLGEAVPGAVGLLGLADALRDDDDHRPGVVRTALRPGEISAEDRAAMVRARRGRAQAVAKAKRAARAA